MLENQQSWDAEQVYVNRFYEFKSRLNQDGNSTTSVHTSAKPKLESYCEPDVTTILSVKGFNFEK